MVDVAENEMQLNEWYGHSLPTNYFIDANVRMGITNVDGNSDMLNMYMASVALPEHYFAHTQAVLSEALSPHGLVVEQIINSSQSGAQTFRIVSATDGQSIAEAASVIDDALRTLEADDTLAFRHKERLLSTNGESYYIELNYDMLEMSRAPILQVMQNNGVDLNEAELFIDREDNMLRLILPKGMVHGVEADAPHDVFASHIVGLFHQANAELLLDDEQRFAALPLEQRFDRVFERPQGDSRSSFWEIYASMNPEATAADLHIMRTDPDVVLERMRRAQASPQEVQFYANAFTMFEDAIAEYEAQSLPGDRPVDRELIQQYMAQEFSRMSRLFRDRDNRFIVSVPAGLSPFNTSEETVQHDARGYLFRTGPTPFLASNASDAISFFDARADSERLQSLQTMTSNAFDRIFENVREAQNRSANTVQQSPIHYVPQEEESQIIRPDVPMGNVPNRLVQL